MCVIIEFLAFVKVGKVVLQYASHLYVVEVDGKLLICNHKFLKNVSKSSIALSRCDNFNFDDNSNCQDHNVNNEPTIMSNLPMDS